MDFNIVIGDGSDLETLRKAGAERAKAIFALLDDDSENAFVVLAARELNVCASQRIASLMNYENLQTSGICTSQFNCRNMSLNS